MSELMEEYERFCKKLLRYTIYVVISVHVLLFVFEGFPPLYLLIGVIMHLLYFRLIPQFPRIELSNVIFIICCILLVLDHTVWFKHFTENVHHFEEILAFYLICVWTVPLSFFIGLTTNDDTLPYGSTVNSTGEPIGKKKKTSRIVSLLQSIQEKGRQWLRLDNDYKSF